MNINNPELNADWIKTFENVRVLAILNNDIALAKEIEQTKNELRGLNIENLAKSPIKV